MKIKRAVVWTGNNRIQQLFWIMYYQSKRIAKKNKFFCLLHGTWKIIPIRVLMNENPFRMGGLRPVRYDIRLISVITLVILFSSDEWDRPTSLHKRYWIWMMNLFFPWYRMVRFIWFNFKKLRKEEIAALKGEKGCWQTFDKRVKQLSFIVCCRYLF